MSNLILFGAGASFGSNSTFPHCPPLGDQLFNELIKLGGVASEVPEDLKNTFRNNFEIGMKEYHKRQRGDVMSFQREMGGYFSKFIPLIRNNYLRLIKELIECDVIYSSLNYDLLFELSANKILYFANYSNIKSDHELNILKIHGSCNFWPDTTGVSYRGCVFAEGRQGDILTKINVKSQPESTHLSQTEDSIAPAMALYAEGKSVRVSPYFVQRQYEMWCDTVTNASNIFIIGVRIHLADKHIWEVIGNSNSHIHYFGFESDKDMFDLLSSSYPATKFTFYKSDFTGAISIISKIIKNK